MPALPDPASSLLSRLDLSDHEVASDARLELTRAADDPAKLAVWAAKWGEALVLSAASHATRRGGNVPLVKS